MLEWLAIGAIGLLDSCVTGSYKRSNSFLWRLYDHSISLVFEDAMVWLRSKNDNFSSKSLILLFG